MFKKILFLVFLVPITLTAQNIDSLKTIAYGKANDSIKIDALHKLGVSFLNSDLKKALRFNKDCFALSRKSKLDFGMAKSYNLRGIIHDINGNVDSSYYCYYKAQYHVKKVKLPITEASINNNLGLLDWNSGKYSSAINYYVKALKIFEKIDDKEGQANALSNNSLYLSAISATKGQPALERKPSSGPIFLSRMNCSTSAGSKVRPAGVLPKEKPQPSLAPSTPVQV